MRVRLPLYAKILLWFFLNLVALAVVFVFLFNAQFNFKLDWLLATGAGQRLQAVRDLIVGELDSNAPDDWSEVLQRYSEAHNIDFALFDEQGTPLVGAVRSLPPEVKTRMLEHPSPPPGHPPGKTPPKDKPALKIPPPPPDQAVLRTTNPTRYWVLTGIVVDNRQLGGPIRLFLVARSNSLSAGGLIFNPKPWIALGIGAIIFSLLFWIPLVRHITRCIAQLTLITQQIAEGKFDVQLEGDRWDELGLLSKGIRQMANRLDGFATGHKRFLGDVAHELCSPLARLQMALGILEQRATPEQAVYVQSASEKAGQIATLVNELLSFSKATYGTETLRVGPVKLADVVADAVRQECTGQEDVQVAVALSLYVQADRDLLLRAIANLLRNAMRYARSGGPIELQATRAGRQVALRVADSGPGIPESDLPRIFDPFYRVDPSRTRGTGGTGLGLTIVKSCVTACGGTLVARNRSPHGLEIVITLPTAS